MKKERIRIFILVFIAVLFVFVLLGIFQLVKFIKLKNRGWAQDPYLTVGHERQAYGSVLTEQDHLKNIKDIEKRSNNGRTKAEVYMLYSFDEVPEYFLIQHYSVNTKGEIVPAYFVIGFIEKDVYYLITARKPEGYYGSKGENPYSLKGVIEGKKYFAEKSYYGDDEIFAWEKDGKIIGYDPQANYKNGSYDREEEFELTEELKADFKKNRFVADANTVNFEELAKDGYYKTEYQSEFTAEEHEERIRTLYEEDGYEVLYVSILYSFEGYPEYFCIEAYMSAPSGGFIVGYIEKDKYYMIWDNYCGIFGEELRSEENPYEIAEVLDNKKYYAPGGQFAWETDDGKIVGYEVVDDFVNQKYVVHKNIIEITEAHIEFYKSINYIKYDEIILLSRNT